MRLLTRDQNQFADGQTMQSYREVCGGTPWASYVCMHAWTFEGGIH
jgi:hypothetical protein